MLFVYISKIKLTLDSFIFIIVTLSDDLNLASNSTSILSMVRTVPSLSEKYHDCKEKVTMSSSIFVFTITIQCQNMKLTYFFIITHKCKYLCQYARTILQTYSHVYVHVCLIRYKINVQDSLLYVHRQK